MTVFWVVNGLVWEVLPWIEYQREQDDPQAQQDEGWVLTEPLHLVILPPRDLAPR